MRILVDRRIGGFGDLMMLSTPMAKLLDGKHEIGMVIASKWHCLFKNWNIKLMETPSGAWDRVYNVHNPCPASVFEVAALRSTRIGPEMARGIVPSTRIEAFSHALDVDSNLDIEVPTVLLSNDELLFGERYVSKMTRPTVYVQADAAERYKSWDYFDELCEGLEQNGVNTIVVGKCGSRQSLSCDILSSVGVMRACDLVISTDSMAVHGSAAVGTPCVLVAGPMNPGARISTYPYASSISLTMPCAPCWRNEMIPCHISNGRDSSCMIGLSSDVVLRHVLNRLSEITSGIKTPGLKYEGVPVVDRCPGVQSVV